MAATWPGVADQDGDPADFEKLRVHKRGCELAVEQTHGRDASLVACAGADHVHLHVLTATPDEPPLCQWQELATRLL
ncbi:hypothetical protein ACQP2T_51035 [Nonomuraea sp. CA-143628]|uniref:hypothetical protein n=1 Tax=Nonomuraea sp. CA-143628 TaxID=3239997 RepID=UPI003D924A2A